MLKMLTISLALLFLSPVVGAGSLQDGDFTNWMFDATGTATVNREAADGNSGARLGVTTVSGSLVYGTAVMATQVISTPLQGESFNMSLDFLSGPGSFGVGQAIQLLVEQQGSIYGTFLDVTGYSVSWSMFSKSGRFNETSFARLIGSGPAKPDFSGNTPTSFGFAAGNEKSGTLTQYYDNFRLQSLAISPVPEPETYALMLAGLGLVGFAARRQSQ